MKKYLSCLIGLALLGVPVISHADASCGDEGLSCSDQERCCENVVAIFAGANASAPPYIHGACVPQEQKCADFWCGNQQCKDGFFTNPTVCCINIPEGVGSREYACASSELSCPGNAQRLTIRDTQPTRSLRRG